MRILAYPAISSSAPAANYGSPPTTMKIPCVRIKPRKPMRIDKITDEDGFTLKDLLLDIYDRLDHIEEDISEISKFIQPCIDALDDTYDDEQDEYDKFFLPPPYST
jgi:hypothetical protein